ncbi:hypothetical protein P9J83_02660 [Clostridium sporogenes]|uniref:Uncharacterized protein n=1 Tax=Clostridium sporogenes TaxID=1509 RepID=A0AAE4FJR8_CLOSG|nr:hypothetical protein [Clostridium sporogenes]MDS1002401.1 hypothetical protein [Clostridium sporogenes]
MKKSKALIMSSILGIMYSIYLIVYFSGAVSGSGSNAEAVGGYRYCFSYSTYDLCNFSCNI